MGAHSRPRAGVPGKHRGASAPLLDIDLDLGQASTRAGVVLTTAGVAAGVVVAGAGAAGAAPTARASAASAQSTGTQSGPDITADLASLRYCESSDHYGDDTGNGYYGAYQFNLDTWDGLGLHGLPSQASPATQDAAATRLQSLRGWEPWPACSARLGLTDVAGSRSTQRGTLRPSTGLTSVAVAVRAPAFDGQILSAALVKERRSDVLVWQSRMARRGWPITVDGYFGPQSARTAQEFAAEKGIAVAHPGTVSDAVWSAAWTAPVTP